MGLLAKAIAIREQAEKQHETPTVDQWSNNFAAELLASVETGEVEYAPRHEVKFHEEKLKHMYTRAFTPQPLPLMTTSSKPKPTAPKPRPKFRKFAAGLAMGLVLSTAAPFSSNRSAIRSKIVQPKAHPDMVQPTLPNADYINQFMKELAKTANRVTPAERDMLAQMLYGEAGRGVDKFEVLHTVLNRMASPLFKGTVTDIVTAKNQYVGYNPKLPVDPDLRRVVDFVVNEWEANGCQPIQDCDRLYFVTGQQGINNKFEISPDHQGRWVPAAEKKYAPLGHYCHVANDQAARYADARTADQ